MRGLRAYKTRAICLQDKWALYWSILVTPSTRTHVFKCFSIACRTPETFQFDRLLYEIYNRWKHPLNVGREWIPFELFDNFVAFFKCKIDLLAKFTNGKHSCKWIKCLSPCDEQHRKVIGMMDLNVFRKNLIFDEQFAWMLKSIYWTISIWIINSATHMVTRLHINVIVTKCCKMSEKLLMHLMEIRMNSYSHVFREISLHFAPKNVLNCLTREWNSINSLNCSSILHSSPVLWLMRHKFCLIHLFIAIM